MTATRWTVGYLPADRENVNVAACGVEVGAAAARGAAAAALVDLIGRVGRCEYRVVVDDVPVIVIPGLTDRGDVDVVGLPEDVEAMLARG